MSYIGFTLLWGCGLKFYTIKVGNDVFSFTLLWGCGLKFAFGIQQEQLKCFTLLWGCGLKLECHPMQLIGDLFHPLMRVWIEIQGWDRRPPFLPCFTLLWGCGLKFVLTFKALYHLVVSPSYEGVDWNKPWDRVSHGYRFHPLMRVWIEIIKSLPTLSIVSFHPLMRVWIEIILIDFALALAERFTLLWGCGLKFEIS